MEGFLGRGPCSYFKGVYYSSICIRVQRIQWHKHLERSNYGTSRPKIPSCPLLLLVVHRASEGTMLFAYWPEVVGWHSTSHGRWKFFILEKVSSGSDKWGSRLCQSTSKTHLLTLPAQETLWAHNACPKPAWAGGSLMWSDFKEIKLQLFPSNSLGEVVSYLWTGTLCQKTWTWAPACEQQGQLCLIA